jgi:sarcosine oxidase
MSSDVIVVGAGVVGLSAAFELFRGGHRVTVISADVPGSRQSAGLSRIFRLAHADGELTDAAARSLALWEEWETLAGRPLLNRVGLLLTGDMSDREVHLRHHGGLRHLTGAAHPLAVAQGHWAFEETGAAIHAEDTVRFLQSGFSLVLGEVVGVDAAGVTTGDGRRLEADAVVVCAGPETYGLVGLPEPDRVRSVRFSFALREPPSASAPCWIHRDEHLCEPFYAVMDGPDHYSIGLSGAPSSDLPEAEQVRDAHGRVVKLVTRVFPGLVAVAERVITCETSLNPSAAHAALAHDGWDLRHVDGVITVAGPSLFKFAPLLGRLVAEQVAATELVAR